MFVFRVHTLHTLHGNKKNPDNVLLFRGLNYSLDLFILITSFRCGSLSFVVISLCLGIK